MTQIIAVIANDALKRLESLPTEVGEAVERLRASLEVMPRAGRQVGGPLDEYGTEVYTIHLPGPYPELPGGVTVAYAFAPHPLPAAVVIRAVVPRLFG
ncbi:hypothetical protein RCO28_25275 [Streptomyces sp. LHD-70]|uniref:hypothetical protein n=1 Tax=Streptomyces sp. LHD-70 TaxID=3072140 RepID=UPI00280D2B51|nr:hypothetical protein [Streptomyces sp. LHD-70]MDQ8705783.1 hypothetical protein [Streptomyces sp. LHD-70]